MRALRNGVGLFGVICGLIVIVTVGLFGYSTADSEAARWNMAFLYGVVAAGGLFGHAVAVAVWSINRFWASLIGIVCVGALIINLSNSLGALAGRNAKATAESSSKTAQIADDRAELNRLQKLVNDIGRFTPTDAAAVTAAASAVDTAKKQRITECGERNEKRGTNCKAREGDERKALDALATATSNKAATDRATDLEAKMAPIRERLRTVGTIAPTNVQGHAIAKLFRLPDSEAEYAATMQNFMLAAIVEFLIVLSMVAFELLGRAGRNAVAVPVAQSPPPVATPPPPPEKAKRLVTEDKKPSATVHRLPTPQQPAGRVSRFLIEIVAPSTRSKVEIADVYVAYRAWCGETKVAPLDLDTFGDQLAAALDVAGIEAREIRNRVYLMGVSLSAQAQSA